MNRIKSLQLNNFKFFQAEKPIEFNNNNLLLYGENGSGKSSIYWALYTLFEASLKKNPEDIRKYFSKSIKLEDNLINIHAKENPAGSDNYDSFIELLTTDVPEKKYRISKTDVAINTNTDAKFTNYASDFINYRMLLGISAFRHSWKIDLFGVFVEDIFKYVQFSKVKITRNGVSKELTNAFEIWQEIEQGHEIVDSVRSSKPRKIRAYKYSNEWKEFEALIKSFNDSLKKKIDYINVQAPIYFKQLGYDFSFYLELEKEASYIKGETTYEHIPFVLRVHIPEYEKEKNALFKPHSFLNEAKLSALAISIRLAILSEKRQENCLKFIVLDDLLISLDMRNREKVLELLLSPEFVDHYQLIVLTHDRLFFQLAKTKIKLLGQTNWVNYEMFEDVIDGQKRPFIRTEDSYIEKARNQYYIYKDHESAGNYLRKQAELFCKDFLPHRLHFERKTFAELNLSGKLLACIEFAKENNLDTALFEKLDSHRKYIFNALSHDSYDVPLFKNELEASFDTFKELAKLRSVTAFLPETKLHFEISDGTDTWRYDIELYDEFKLIKEDGKPSILSTGMINYYVHKTTEKRKKNPEHKRQDIKTMYDYAFSKSDKVKKSDFWEEVIISATGQPLKSIRTF